MQSYNKVIRSEKVDNKSDDFAIQIISADIISSDDNFSTGNSSGDKMIFQAKKRADQIIKSGLQRREKLLKETNTKIESIKKEAYQEGYDEGLKKGKKDGLNQGYQQGLKNAERIKEQAKILLNDAHNKSKRYIDEMNSDIIKFIIDTSKKITGLVIDQHDENITRMIINALKELRNRELIIIKCHPENIAHINYNKHKLSEMCPNAVLSIVEDALLEVNGCVIETEKEKLDLQISKQLNNLYEILKELGMKDE